MGQFAKRLLLLASPAILLCCFAGAQAFNPNAYQGSACLGNGSPSYCNGAQPVLSTATANTNAITQVVMPAPAPMSNLDIHNYLYANATTRVMMHYQPWFKNVSSFNSHLNVGYNENDSATVTAQLMAMKALGVNVVVPDYYGNHSTKAFNLATVDAMAAVIAANPNAYPKMALSLDSGSWSSTAATETNSHQCKKDSDGGSVNTAAMELCVEDQIDYAAQNYFFQSWYERFGGKPILMFFLDEASWASVDWDAVWVHVHAHVQSGQSCGTSCTYTASVLIIGRNSGPLTRTGMDGAFAWSPTQTFNNASPGTQLQWNGTSNYLDNFYSVARANPSKLAIGLIYKGFDDSNASFGTGKVIAQQMGQVLKFSADKIASSGYSAVSQIPYVQVQTWNDVEEGTSVESGVENGFTISATKTGTTLNWTITPTDATYSSLTTVDHLRVIYGSGSSFLTLADSLPVASTNASLLSIPVGTWNVCVEMVGKPLVFNHLSNCVSYTNSGTSTSFSGSITANLKLNKPSRDARNWDQLLNQNWDILDSTWGGGSPNPTPTPTAVSDGSVVVSDSLNFDVAPISPSSLVAGSNTVTFSTCPKGVNSTDTIANNNPHYIWIHSVSGDTAPDEPVFITGGAGVSESVNCTISFISGFAHSAGYHIKSATSGIQEAVQMSGVNPGGSVVLVARKTYTCNAPIFLSRSDFKFVGQFAILQDNSFESCLVAGSRTSFGVSGGNQNADISGIRFMPVKATWSVIPTGSISGSNGTETVTIPTCPNNFWAAIPNQILWVAGTASGLPTTPYGHGEFAITTGMGTCVPGLTNGTVQISSLSFVNTVFSAHDHGYSLSNNAGPYIEDATILNGHIHHMRYVSNDGVALKGFGLMVDNDQAFATDNLDMDAGFWLRNDADFQGAGIFSPGPFSTSAAVAAIGPNVNISNAPSCVRWYDGNDITFYGNICQNFSFGAVTVGTKRGGFGRFFIGPNNHFEVGATNLPFGAPIGDPCMSLMGSNKALTGLANDCEDNSFVSQNSSPWPTFPGAGGTPQYYYLVAHNNTLAPCTSGGDCVTAPTLIGKANVTDPSANPVAVTFYGWGSGIVNSPSAQPSTYDLLRKSAVSGFPQPPTTVDTVAVATGISPASICNIHNLCTITDNVATASLASYTPVYLATSAKRYSPIIQLLPGVVSLTGNGTVNPSIPPASYRGTPACLNSPDFYGKFFVGSFWGVNPPFGAGEPGSCPPIIAAISSQGTSTQCFSASGTCGSASSGFVTIAASATTVTVNSAAVKMGSKISVWEDTTVNPLIGAGCNSTLGRTYAITGVVPGTSFTITSSAAPSSTAACLGFKIGND